jgi:hypothetical protein
MPAYHSVPLDPHQAPATPSIAPLRGLTPMRWNPSRNAMVAQDTVVGQARRLIFAFGLRGRDTWPWDSADATTDWPFFDEWRRVFGPIDVSLTPGSFLRLRVLYVPCGQTITHLVVGGAPVVGPVTGAIRAGVAWSNANTSSSHALTYYDRTLDAAPDGELPAGPAAYWGALREIDIDIVAPPAQAGGAIGLADYSEGTIASIRLEVQGGARIVDAVLYEYPAPHHVQRHDDTFAASVHGAHVNDQAPGSAMTPGPQEVRRAFLTNDERRFGTEQTLRAAHRQTERLGPHVFSWSPWVSVDSYEATNSLGAEDVEPWILTGTTNLREIVSAATSYSDTSPGWIVAASYAQLHRYCDPLQVIRGGNRAVVPVRCRVRARWTGASGFGRVRIQSSSTEWVDVDFDDTTVLETREVVGWLESQAAADQPRAVLQIFGQLTHASHSLQLYAVEIDWGWYG